MSSCSHSLRVYVSTREVLVPAASIVLSEMLTLKYLAISLCISVKVEEVEAGMVVTPVEREVIDQVLVVRVYISTDFCLIEATEESSGSSEVRGLMY